MARLRFKFLPNRDRRNGEPKRSSQVNGEHFTWLLRENHYLICLSVESTLTLSDFVG
jgi:hypothetical protein